jgi:hypothetical protein
MPCFLAAALAFVTIGWSTCAYPQEYKFGGPHDAEFAASMLKAFGPTIIERCGHPTTGAEVTMTLDLDSSPLMVSLDGGGGSNPPLPVAGPVTSVSWMKSTAPNEFGYMKPVTYLGSIDFKVGDGTGEMMFDLPHGSYDRTSLGITVRGRTWGYYCHPTMVISH